MPKPVQATLRNPVISGASRLSVFGGDVQIGAGVFLLEPMPIHADGILHWLGFLPNALSTAFPCHSEPEAMGILRFQAAPERGWKAQLPEHLETIRVEHPR
ncbi:hypothetical protein [Leisingera aquimarina]|uniref:hypothetical protein n=1 Tax=Leisingera aquimarina TaxID=476529 RepID=UPI0012EC18CC|nr:hypothetical protein [Leisingera aquimarina]